jgi:hypothetical protein
VQASRKKTNHRKTRRLFISHLMVFLKLPAVFNRSFAPGGKDARRPAKIFQN